MLVVGLLGAGVAACGGSSSSSSSTTTTTAATTTSTSQAATGSGTTGSAGGSGCAQAIQVLQTLGQQVHAASGNPQAIVNAVRSTIPQLQSAANQSSGEGRTALDNLVNAFKSIGNGATGQQVSTDIANAVTQLTSACT